MKPEGVLWMSMLRRSVGIGIQFVDDVELDMSFERLLHVRSQ